jgi:hypothetical protein
MLLGPSRNRHNKHDQEPDPGDGAGPYSYDKLLKMDQCYCSAVERAFKLGTESREAAERLFKANWNVSALADGHQKPRLSSAPASSF